MGRQVPPDNVSNPLQNWGTRADFKPDHFDVAIRQKGYKVVWEQSMFCSCIDPTSGQPDYVCPACRGKGYIYFNPTSTRALVTSISGHKEQDRIGLNEQGVAYLTPLSSDNVGFRDRFTFVDATIKYSEVIKRGNGTSDPTGYYVKSMVRIDVLGTPLAEGVDFKVSDDGLSIEWLTNAVPSGYRYALLYNTNPVYIAIGPLHELRGTYSMYHGHGEEQFIPLPKQFQIKREDFINDKAWGS